MPRRTFEPQGVGVVESSGKFLRGRGLHVARVEARLGARPPQLLAHAVVGVRVVVAVVAVVAAVEVSVVGDAAAPVLGPEGGGGAAAGGGAGGGGLLLVRALRNSAIK